MNNRTFSLQFFPVITRNNRKTVTGQIVIRTVIKFFGIDRRVVDDLKRNQLLITARE